MTHRQLARFDEAIVPPWLIVLVLFLVAAFPVRC